MSTLPLSKPDQGRLFAGGFAFIAVLAAMLAGWIPIAFSIATVFLFAGPHNWLEARYILGRLPARTGKLWPFFAVSFLGIVGLTAGFALIPSYLRNSSAMLEAESLYGIWDSVFLVWLATLVTMRSRTNPRFEAGWVWPLMFMLVAGVWLEPFAFGFALVYLHPLMALWLLDRELRRSHREWLPAYRRGLLVMPMLLLALVARLHSSPNLPGDDPVSRAITGHAGDWFLAGVSSHLLVALHTFLEMVHYGVWVVLIPLVGYRSRAWELETIPVARRGGVWRKAVVVLLLFGLLLVLTLWSCFLLDYGTTRSVYFTVAMLHVLAEIPFLLRMI
ncbi:hypothetical protein [Zavarzinella formosa]|uniref:hypothetical protein n=1 Tax=Zavarzinella formosa TaxID=360055 RepID=UPI0002E4F78B|nr:hypothetical protein [Zavarzinella formosa]